MTPDSDSNYLYKSNCSSCGSSDANAVYDDGHTYCFSCRHFSEGDDAVPTKKSKKPTDLLTVSSFPAWKSRGLTAQTCKKWGLGIAEYQGKFSRVFQYRSQDGSLVAQKVRPSVKEDMKFLRGSNDLLFGQHLWGSGGKMVIVTEGEVDAVSISQVQGHKWPVVSVSSGASGARKALQANLEWLQTFETVVLWFDDDGPGREAVEACAPLFKPGQVKTAALAPFKDANEALVAGEKQGIVQAIWQAKEWRPDGIVSGQDLWAALSTPDPIPSLQLPWSGLQQSLRGVRDGEVVTIIAGTGAGKSTFVRELASFYLEQKKRVGMLMLEETPVDTALDLIGHKLNKNLRDEEVPSNVKGFKQAFDATMKNLFLFDHFGSIAMDNVEARMRYMAKACECDVLVLDHISIMVSGVSDGDERRLIDNICTRLKTLSMEIRKPIFVVSHVRRESDGKGHEEGGRVRMNQIRGSQAIGQLSNIVIALERDQQSKSTRDVTTVRVLKGRRRGLTGVACKLKYDHKTGKLNELETTFEEDQETSDFF